jgi:hypothetical protein
MEMKKSGANARTGEGFRNTCRLDANIELKIHFKSNVIMPSPNPGSKLV